MKHGQAMAIGIVMAAALGAAAAMAGDDPAPDGAAANWTKSCASCHGPDGKGNARMVRMLRVDTAALDLTNTATRGSKDEDLTKTITDGKGKMPKYGAKLSAAEIAGLVGHIRGLAAASSTTFAVATAAVPAAYTKHCASCHGRDGRGNDRMTKTLKCNLAALDLLDDATLGKTDEALVKTTTDGEDRMPAYGRKLIPEDIRGIVAWMRAAKPAK